MNRILVRPEIEAQKIECEFKGIVEYENEAKFFAAFLGESGVDEGVGIVVKNEVARAIAVFVEDLTLPQPSVYELTGRMVTSLGYRLDSVYIDHLVKDENRYCAKLLLSNDQNYLELDWTSGEAIATAMLCKCPIYVADDLYREYRQEMEFG